MKILIARAIPPGVLQALQADFEVVANQEDAPWGEAQLAARAGDVDGLFASAFASVGEAFVAAAPRLKVISTMAVGYNNIDLAACRSRAIVVTNAPDVLTETTADMGFALLMATARRLGEGERLIRAGKWQASRWDFMLGGDVHGSTLGILGMGRIGQAVARRGAQGFGMKVIYHNRSQLPAVDEAAVNARYVSKAQLLEQSDHLVLVLPYSAQSHHAIGYAELAQMKRTATLINIARGGIINDAELARALREGLIAGAGLDVFEGEPKLHAELLTLPNIVITPHIGSASLPTRTAMAQLAADNLRAVLAGRKALTPVSL